MRLRAKLDRLHSDLARVPVVAPELRRLVQILVGIGVPERVAWNSVVRPNGEPNPETLAHLAAICNVTMERRGRQPAPEESRQPAAEESVCPCEPNSPA